LGERQAGELGPGGAGRAARGQLAARKNTCDERRAALQRNREGKEEEEDKDLFINFAKVKVLIVK
jgi:hypothetical protein